MRVIGVTIMDYEAGLDCGKKKKRKRKK